MLLHVTSSKFAVFLLSYSIVPDLLYVLDVDIYFLPERSSSVIPIRIYIDSILVQGLDVLPVLTAQ